MPATKRLSDNSLWPGFANWHPALPSTQPHLREMAADVLAKRVLDLLALGDATAADHPGTSTAAIIAYCRQNLHRHQLSPRCVAAHFDISIRTLHLRFEAFGQSFNRWLLDARLDVCGATLRLSPQKRGSISEIAYRWGFNDLSHFNKTFRRRFGMTPSQWRTRNKWQ